ncbi:urea-binding protein : Urea/short-chain amide ABC transporter, periplasmic urea/short-chain amide-binding protein OS=Rhodopirellula sallentina SM41 GN=RSSM_05980 PE=4 SV=1: Pkinase: Peripla_BP_5 [Gemmata massiliana]|uniref:non-specific serine/threonine protein kinase n=1 Tax=Gemmata massiliana TaxID=1210884 RepID=A0A6P2D1L0_9BACT|nr:transporter substrate-binding protein [Gemmata massiliana]VTR94265.1 urea-binding protein : Urea/short-chain amide ABC transporter, periplasmic urea/short-chain amide-binding protein OS=Rhodopirellula sallentina SM41 GN=RSSM_05980 PE=4 SV=1: Pkinase: Peripla_BP_5 [Gemmata massiliana]
MSDPDSAEQTQPGLHPTGDTVSPGARQYKFIEPRQVAGELGRFGNYRVIRLLGSGGMGLVFEAEEVALGRPVALKVLKPELAADPESRERFLREARAAAEIPSDHVVTVLSVGEAGGLPFLAMPLLFGETLQARIERPTLVDLRTALIIARDTAAGLVAAHIRGLIHRDIKPANIWIETSGPGGTFKRARIFDFGLARRLHHETSLTSTGFIVGTPNYMSPEQAAGHEVDARADLFSLGCVMYVMLTGELPFRGKSALAVMSALANKAPDPIVAKNPTVPPAVDALVLRLLEKKPEDRVQSAAEVVAELDDAIASLSGSAPVLLLSPAKVRPVGADTLAPGKSDTLLGTPVAYEPHTERIHRRRAIFVCSGLAVIVALSAFIGWRAMQNQPVQAAPVEPIVVGVLHSQSGTMAVSENPVIDATLLAIEEINAAGGVLGRPLKPVVVDGKSDPDEFARQAERLLTEERVAVIFGCWTSASRKAVRPVFERNAGLLFYPVQYEGLEESPRIVYLGPAPNQQLIPAVDFVIDTLKKKRIALVGSDYVFPRPAHAIIRDRVAERKAAGVDVEVVAEAFIPLGSPLVINAIARVRNANADVVINTINGTTNAAFFRELRDPKQGVPNITSLSVSITENEVRGLDPRAMTDDYLVASYFQTVDRPESRAFVQRIRAKYGSDRSASDMMAAAYSGVYLWAKAATAARGVDPSAVANAVRGLEFDGPGARIKIDPENLHAWLPVRVAKVRPSGEVALVPGAGSETPVRPRPFPPTRSRDEWSQFLRKLEMDWGGKWQAPERAGR